MHPPTGNPIIKFGSSIHHRIDEVAPRQENTPKLLRYNTHKNFREYVVYFIANIGIAYQSNMAFSLLASNITTSRDPIYAKENS